MAQELEPTKEAVPDSPDTALAPYFQAPELTTRPPWTELRSPYRPDSKLEHHWSVAVLPFRALALGFLWVTYSVYTFMIFLATVTLIVIVFFAR